MDARNSNIAKALQEHVYGAIGSSDFPLSLPREDAGPSTYGKRRYLWTDSFGVVNYVSLALTAEKRGDAREREHCLTAASSLLDSIFVTLANPRSSEYPMLPRVSGDGFIGLRIGKVNARKSTDAGMQYDGMYWHYIDKYIFALCCYAHASHDTTAIDRAAQLVREVHPHFFTPAGMRWKINVDCSAIPQLATYPNHDAVSAWVVYRLVQQLGGDAYSTPIVILRSYFTHHVSQAEIMDPLGLGTHLWTAQWLPDHEEDTLDMRTVQAIRRYKQSLITAAPHVLQHNLNTSLPFRLYGALLGAQMTGVPDDFAASAQAIATRLSEMRLRTPHDASDGLYAINTIMLASAVLPLAWKK